MDGIEATRTLREGGNQTHVIALTANVMKKHRDLFEEAGCDDFLSKPIDRSELRQMLKQYLNQEHYE
jgi:CheY-like chemotaxis protein